MIISFNTSTKSKVSRLISILPLNILSREVKTPFISLDNNCLINEILLSIDSKPYTILTLSTVNSLLYAKHCSSILKASRIPPSANLATLSSADNSYFLFSDFKTYSNLEIISWFSTFLKSNR